MKKAQILGEVFMFLLAVVIFTLILIYGYKAISGFTEKGETVALLELQSQLQRQISSMALDYGSTEKMELRLPSETEQICFVDHSQLQWTADHKLEGGAGTQQKYREINPLVKDAIEGRTTQNVFLIPMSNTPMQVENISVDAPITSPGILCVPAIRGQAILLLQGTGKTAKVSLWS